MITMLAIVGLATIGGVVAGLVAWLGLEVLS